jgi:hypothetical protein
VKIRRGFFNSRLSFAGVWILIPILILVGTSLGTTSFTGDKFAPKEEIITYRDQSVTISFSEDLIEGESYTFEFDITNQTVEWVNISATWRDEPDEGGIIRTYENQPDTFRITYSPINGTEQTDSGSNSRNGEGELQFNYHYESEEEENSLGTGRHVLEIQLTSVGQYESRFDLGFLTPIDDGNSIDIRIDYQYREKFITYEEASNTAGH